MKARRKGTRMDKINFADFFVNIALAAFGGIVKVLVELERQPDKQVNFFYYAASATISMFVGSVVFFTCEHFCAGSLLTAGLTSLAGYMGSPLLDLFSSLAKKKIKKEFK